MENRFSAGDIVQHFKREMLSEEERRSQKYLYEIVGTATHSETGDPMMVYRPLYGDGGMYVRPLEMFLSEVDHEKYPDVKQHFRFEKLASVPLSIVVEAVDMASLEGVMYLDIEKPEIVAVPEDYSLYDVAELEELEKKIGAGYGSRYFRLPEQHDVNDQRIMKDFAEALPDGPAKDDVCSSIGGRGTVRRFRDSLERCGLKQEWEAYRQEAYIQIARDWCEKNGIRYTE